MDEALMSVVESETETLELFTHSASAREAVKHIRHIEELTHTSGLHAVPAVAPGSVADVVPAE
jgi:hypothetical protein